MPKVSVTLQIEYEAMSFDTPKKTLSAWCITQGFLNYNKWQAVRILIVFINSSQSQLDWLSSFDSVTIKMTA